MVNIRPMRRIYSLQASKICQCNSHTSGWSKILRHSKNILFRYRYIDCLLNTLLILSYLSYFFLQCNRCLTDNVFQEWCKWSTIALLRYGVVPVDSGSTNICNAHRKLPCCLVCQRSNCSSAMVSVSGVPDSTSVSPFLRMMLSSASSDLPLLRLRLTTRAGTKPWVMLAKEQPTALTPTGSVTVDNRTSPCWLTVSSSAPLK